MMRNFVNNTRKSLLRVLAVSTSLPLGGLGWALALSISMSSCLDTIILPDDKTVDEDFWKTKGDVAKMVNAAYASMTSEDVITRMIVWGDYRSDELVRSASLSGSIPDALDEMAAVSMQTTNQFATWAGFYDVINKCNIVLARAEAVQYEDPNYLSSDYESDRCQMLALRSLCYFYLLRNYHDVPYVTEAYMNSSQNVQVAQSSPKYVLDRIIETLEEVTANSNCLRANSFTTSEWRRVGWMTLDGANALLADCYLWRASVMKDAADYQKCIDRCNMVIESKSKQHVTGIAGGAVTDYPLAANTSRTNAYTQLYVNQNAEESIYELQSRNNSAVFKYLYKYSGDNSSEGYLKASAIFKEMSANVAKLGENNVFGLNDLRYYAACFFDANSSESFHVRKMMSTSGVSAAKTESRASAADRKGSFDQNYIIYRLPDVMLMKAEAIVQLMQDVSENASDEEKATINEANLQVMREAFNMVQAVNTRSLLADNQADSLKWNNFKTLTKDLMEKVVMEERLREFCFEGKRWYDLLRYAYRHMEGVQYDKTFGDLADAAAAAEADLNLPAIYPEMLKLMTRSRGTDAAAVQTKMRNEAYLYLPIPERDINVSKLLKQNPVYQSSSDYQKSY